MVGAILSAMANTVLPALPTRAQLETLRRFEETLASLDYSPSLRDVARRMNLAHTSLGAMLERCMAGGWVKRTRTPPGFKIARPLPRDGIAAVPIAAVGAGADVVAVDAPPELVELRHLSEGHPGYQIARVKGDSMSGDAIRPDDVAIVREQPSIESRDIGLWVLPDGRLLLKRHRWERGRLLLLSSNPAYEPILAPEGTVLRGKLIQVVRNFE